MFKSKVLIKITNFKTEDEKMVKHSEFFETIRGKDLQNSLSNKHPMEWVDAKPENFVFGVVYVLKTGDRAWVFNKVD